MASKLSSLRPSHLFINCVLNRVDLLQHRLTVSSLVFLNLTIFLIHFYGYVEIFLNLNHFLHRSIWVETLGIVACDKPYLVRVACLFSLLQLKPLLFFNHLCLFLLLYRMGWIQSHRSWPYYDCLGLVAVLMDIELL